MWIISVAFDSEVSLVHTPSLAVFSDWVLNPTTEVVFHPLLEKPAGPAAFLIDI